MMKNQLNGKTYKIISSMAQTRNSHVCQSVVTREMWLTVGLATVNMAASQASLDGHAS
jgi:hypothetical protein